MRRFCLFTIVLAAMLLTNWLRSPARMEEGFRPGQKHEKIALLIGISKYPESTLWDSLHCRRDVEMMSIALQRQGFKKIRILLDDAATKEEIIKEIQRLDPAPGATVTIFFSGHGDQLPDDGDLDFEPDGKDEALVPYDAPSPQARSEGYAGDQHLRDDEIHQLLDVLRSKAGSNGEVLLIVDACFSGTIDRTNESLFAAGGGMVAPTRSSGLPAGDSTRLKKSGLYPITGRKSLHEMAPLIVMTAARSDQSSREVMDQEGKYVGPLTFAFCQTLEQAEPGMTYQAFFDLVKAKMESSSSSQEPQIEGAYHKEMFGGEMVERHFYFYVAKWEGRRECLVNQGMFAGLGLGSIVALYPPDTRSPESVEPLMTGRVVEASHFHARIAWDRPVRNKMEKRGWIMLKTKNYGDLRARIKFTDHAEPRYSLLRDSILKSGYSVAVDKNPQLLLLSIKDTLALITEQGEILYQETQNEERTPTGFPAELGQKIENYTRGKLLHASATAFKDQRYRLDVSIVPGRYDPRLRDAIPVSEGLFSRKQYHIGDTFFLKIRHRGKDAAYFNVIYLEKNTASLLAPQRGESMDNFLLNPHDSVLIDFPWVFTSEDGAGFNAHFMVLASEDKLDLRGILDSPISTRSYEVGDLSPLERLFYGFLHDRTTRSEALKVNVDRVWVGELVVWVRENELKK